MWHAPRTHANEGHLFDPFVAFDDFVSDSGKGATDPVRIHDGRHVTSSRPRRTAVKESNDYMRGSVRGGAWSVQAGSWSVRTV